MAGMIGRTGNSIVCQKTHCSRTLTRSESAHSAGGRESSSARPSVAASHKQCRKQRQEREH